ncbi:MAG: ATP-binding cassette domain-containing protein [Caldilineaceae bacterium]
MTVPTPPGRDILEIKNLRKFFPIRKGLMRRVVGHVKAVDDVTFNIRKGETLSLVGESGCGKTTTSLHPARAHAHVGPDSLPHREPDGRRRGHAAQVRAASPAPADADDLPGSLFIAQPRMTISRSSASRCWSTACAAAERASGSRSCWAWSTCRRST